MNLLKLPPKVLSILNNRLVDEYNAMQMYRAMSNWCNNVGYFKAGEYYQNESNDEREHAKKIEEFIVKWNGTPLITNVKPPQLEYENLYETIEMAYKAEADLYEKYETDSKEIFEIGDICVFDFLEFFREVQTTSVAEFSDKINMLEGVEKTKMNLLLLENKLF